MFRFSTVLVELGKNLREVTRVGTRQKVFDRGLN